MKAIKFSLFVVASLLIVSCGKKENEENFGGASEKEVATEVVVSELSVEEKGKEIFEGKGACLACHKPTEKVVGPSLQEIAKIYKDKNASIVTFLKGEGEAIVDPSQFEVMKANFAITKNMSDEELQSLESYIYSHLQ
jgi:cytochrome c